MTGLPVELLTVAEMAEAERLATSGTGLAMIDLMERAGSAVARATAARCPAGPVVVLCGPGNNGGDGFVAARLLAAQGREVTVALLGAREALKGDAAVNAARWEGRVVPLGPAVLPGAAVAVDALFGSGLARPLDGVARQTVEALASSGIASIAVDVPSGVEGDTGAVLGAAAPAAVTVAFFRRRPAHLLMPSRLACGTTRVADIGIRATVLERLKPRNFANAPGLWAGRYPWPRADGHKYDRGQALVRAGAVMTGAARLAALAALRAGAGLVVVAAPVGAATVLRSGPAGLIVRAAEGAADFAALAADSRTTAVLVGPGNGVDAATRRAALDALAAGKATVLDADALTVFAGGVAELAAALAAPGAGRAVLTPHAGEFARLFPDRAGGEAGRLASARAAAAAVGAVVLLKGADTVIAAPDGRAAITANAPPDLATAGSGDVLGGFVAALLAQGMPPFEAACAAAWLHGAAGTRAGPGLIAEDLPDAVPAVLAGLRAKSM
ncbi:MAG: NAD(P)H-hydrate dehydratase [Alphaproteobacteria bacterium]